MSALAAACMHTSARMHTHISSIHDIPQGPFGYETLSDKVILTIISHY